MRPLVGKVEFKIVVDRPLIVWQEEDQVPDDLLKAEAEAMRAALEEHLSDFPFEDTVTGSTYNCWIAINGLERKLI